MTKSGRPMSLLVLPKDLRTSNLRSSSLSVILDCLFILVKSPTFPHKTFDLSLWLNFLLTDYCLILSRIKYPERL